MVRRQLYKYSVGITPEIYMDDFHYYCDLDYEEAPGGYSLNGTHILKKADVY